MSPDSTGTRPAVLATSSVVKATGYFVADLLSEVVRIFFFCHVCILKLYIASNFFFSETARCNFLSGETFVLRVKVVSNRVSEDGRGHVGRNDCWKCLFKVRCSSNVQEYGY